MVIVRGGLVQLRGHEFLERRFLLRAALKDKQHALHRQSGCDRAAVEFRAGKRVDVATERSKLCFVHGLRDAGPDVARLPKRMRGSEPQNRKNCEEPHGNRNRCLHDLDTFDATNVCRGWTPARTEVPNTYTRTITRAVNARSESVQRECGRAPGRCR